METHVGNCQCGNVDITLTLNSTPSQYTPRQCDCDFCTKYKVAYLSDPKGQLEIRSCETLSRLQQGSGQAKFLICKRCDTLVAATYQRHDSMIGALNFTLLASKTAFNAPQASSPKTLVATDKLERWKKLWMGITMHEPV